MPKKLNQKNKKEASFANSSEWNSDPKGKHTEIVKRHTWISNFGQGIQASGTEAAARFIDADLIR